MQDKETTTITRRELIELLNEDLSHEMRAVAFYADSSRQLAETADSSLSSVRKVRAEAGLGHAMAIAAQIDALGGEPAWAQAPAIRIDAPEDLIRHELDDALASISRYGTRVKQCELLGEHMVAQSIRHIQDQEQEHLERLLLALEDSGVRLQNQPEDYMLYTV